MTMLHVEQCSLELEDRSDERNLADVAAALRRTPDVCGFTELRKSEVSGFNSTLHSLGYTAAPAGYHDVAIAVHNSHKVLDSGVLSNVAPGRDLVWATFAFGDDVVTFCETHWHTIRADKHRNSADAQTRALIDKITAEAMGTRLAFFGGDTNHDMAHDNPIKDALNAARLVTVQEALAEWTPTHAGGSVIDVVGYDSLDTRVEVDSMEVWPKGHSDHNAVSGHFRIRRLHYHHHHHPH